MINVTKSTLPPFEEYCNEIKDIWDSHWLTNMGKKHCELELLLKQKLAAKNVCLFTNGHLALEAILRVYNLKGEVITSPFTFASTVHAIVRLGLKPVFCDIDPINFTIDPNKIESLINENTCAILPIHVYGNIADDDKISQIAKRHNLKLIYDAAHSFYSFKNGVSTANMGDVSMFSFHATKVFNTIEGGALCFNDPDLKQKLDLEKNFGIPNADSVVYSGGNAKMNEFQAAMGICNLKHLDINIQKRKAVVDLYTQLLGNEPSIRLWQKASDVVANYSYIPVLFEANKRDVVFELLKANDIYTRKYFYPLCNEYECYSFSSDCTPIAKDISMRVLTLPIYPDLSDTEIHTICSLIKEAIK